MRSFVPEVLDTSDFSQIETLFQALEKRTLESVAALEQWLRDCSELGAVLSEAGTKRYIDMTCHTDDPTMEAAYLTWIETIEPQCKPHWHRLNERYLTSNHRDELPEPQYDIYDRTTAADWALFRPENVDLQREEAQLAQQYAKISGAMTLYFDGELRTIPQMYRYLDEQDRRVRQFAWEAIVSRRLANADEFDTLLDRQIAVRDQMAHNAKLPSYVEYAFQMYHRFDYTPTECFAFHDAVEKTCVPLVRQIQERRRVQMGLDRLRPWDLSVDPANRPPLRPFTTAAELAEKTEKILARVDHDLAGEFQALRDANLLDLDSRPGKAPGGYQSTLDEQRVPFIFMNASGRNDDLRTILHEAGHAFHAKAAGHFDLLLYRSAPIEFCEVASMSMELLAGPAEAEVYTPEEHARARRMHYEGIITLLPRIAQIDAFQHWLYTHPAHTHAERSAFWLTLEERFGGIVDWSGYEQEQERMWQRTLHLWQVPFYYIEYGIAQLGALQLWAASLKDPVAALKSYKEALALGGSLPLPDLFAAAGLHFDFSESTVAPLMTMLGEQLTALPE